MGLDCGGSCMKYLLFLFNFIFFVCGAAILGVAIWVLVDPNILDYVGLAAGDASFKAAIYLFIAVGSIIFLVGFLGCCGACKESSCMLGMFAGLMIIILLLQITAGILAAVYQTEVKNTMTDEMAKQAKNVTGQETQALTLTFNLIQTQFECCGSNNPTDYQGGSVVDTSGNPMNVPQSCCVARTPTGHNDRPNAVDYPACNTGWESQDQVNQKGCAQQLIDWINEYALYILGVGFGLAAVEVLGIVLACCVRSKINQKY